MENVESRYEELENPKNNDDLYNGEINSVDDELFKSEYEEELYVPRTKK